MNDEQDGTYVSPDDVDTSDASHDSPQVAAPKRRRRVFTFQRLLLLLIIVTLAVVGGTGYWLWSSEPEYWKQNQLFVAHTSPEQMEQLATNLEKRFAELTLVDAAPAWPGGDPPAGFSPFGPKAAYGSAGSDTRALTISTDEANAWLAARLPQWLSNQKLQLPEQMTNPMVAVEKDKLVFAFRYETPEVNQVISFLCNVSVNDAGKMRVDVAEIKGGKLGAPAGMGKEMIIKHLQKQKAGASEGSAGFERLLSAFEGREFDATFDIDEMRVARVTQFVLRSSGAEMVFRIEPKTADNPKPAPAE